MKKIVYTVVVLGVVLAGYMAVSAMFTKSYDIPTTFAGRGEFIIALNENGTVDATRAVTLSAPRIRGLQITWLAPEGSMVEKGDPVIKFDATKQIADLADHTSTLKINISALERTRNEYTIQEKRLQLDLEKARRAYDEQKHEAPRVAEESRMELELAELNHEAKLEQLAADVTKAEVEVDRAQDKVNLAERELSQVTIRATIPGLVVYLEIWKGGSREKVQEGDSPWPGMGLINLPDLGEMMVKTTVSEVDANKVDTGQEVVVVLDAYPGVEFPGTVSSISTLARRKESGSKINVFDVEVTIIDHDDRLKPGMSASSRIIVERFEDIVSVPLEAVFEKDGKTVVFLKGGKKREVILGLRNDRDIEVTEGLNGDEEICLVDPTLEEAGLPGDKATEPEMNKGRTKSPPQRPGKRSGGRKRGK